jgi:hypothetical protein
VAVRAGRIVLAVRRTRHLARSSVDAGGGREAQRAEAEHVASRAGVGECRGHEPCGWPDESVVHGVGGDDGTVNAAGVQG